MADTGIYASLADLDAATVNAPFAAEVVEQCAIGAADVEHSRARLNEVRDK
jgi:hypothetical protein